MILRQCVFCVLAAAAGSVNLAQAQPVRSCPEGQAVQSVQPSGTVQCVPLPSLGPVNAAISAEAATRAAVDAQLQTNIDALQPPAPTGTTRCYGVHFVRNGGDEVQFSVLFFNNGDLQHWAVIDRITVRDDLGNLLHDSGPKIGIPHPLANAPIPPLDITNVPPGGTFGLSTSDLWGFNNIPQLAAGTRSLSMTAEVTKDGDPKLFTVHSRQIVRQRVIGPTGPTIVTERSNTDSTCFSVPRS